MKKAILFTLVISMAALSDIYAQDYKLNNYGYAKRNGMVGLYGLLPDYIDSKFTDMAPGGGAFIYYNILNDFWGNLAIGFNAEYVAGSYSKKNYFSGYANMAPISFNVAYMTASDFLNAWIGAGISYNFVSFDLNSGIINGNFFGKQGTLHDQVLGGDFFAGAEYIFTKNGRWGVFFEFRYTIAEKAQINADISGGLGKISESLDTQRFRYTVGFTYHY